VGSQARVKSKARVESQESGGPGVVEPEAWSAVCGAAKRRSEQQPAHLVLAQLLRFIRFGGEVAAAKWSRFVCSVCFGGGATGAAAAL